VGGYLLFVLAPLWWTPHSLARPSYGFHGPVTLVANCYVLAGFAFLAVMAVRAFLILAPSAGAERADAGSGLDRG
jgi:alpha-1,2-mannosyltransferase